MAAHVGQLRRASQIKPLRRACPARYNGLILRQRSYKNMTDAKTWMCLICGWIYDEDVGAPEHGIAAGTPWAAVPMNWTCPECGARKEDFEMVQI